MGKILKPLLIGAAIIAIGVATGGIGFVGVGGVVTGISTTGLGGLLLTAGLAEIASGPLSLLNKTPKSHLSQLDRLTASIDPRTGRKTVFGTTAMGTDIRYVESSGTDQEYVDYIIAVAAHKVESVREIWFDDLTAWTIDGGITAKYTDYLTLDIVLEGSSANTVSINGGAHWGAGQRLTGCAYVHLRIKRTGTTSKVQSPFVSGLTSRVTIIGEGMPLYDPRYDSTVPGGSGTMRAADQTTWRYRETGGYVRGDNVALQILNRMLGWKIAGKLSVGHGLPANRIDMESFIDAANLCDEYVAKSAGGTEPRYMGACVLAETDDPQQVLNALLAACNGRLRDGNGKLSLWISHNDLASAVADDGLTDDDVLGKFSWKPVPAFDQSFNIVRGQYTDPTRPNSLYQPLDFPERSVVEGSPDGIDRILTLQLLVVESPSQAQRIASQVLERRQYQGQFTAVFGERATKYKVGSVVPFTFGPLAFSRKLFRVQQIGRQFDGNVPMILVEENDAIYAWDASDAAVVHAAGPTSYDPQNNPLILAINDLDTASAAALADLEAIASDGVLSRGEKPRVVLDYSTIITEQGGIDARATAQGITTELTAYDGAVSALTAYLTGLVPHYNDYTADTTIVSATFIAKFADVYTDKQALLNKIAKVAYDQASSAASSASTALTEITAITADSVLSKGEKPAIVKDYNVIIAEQSGIDAQAVAQSVTTEKTAYDSAVTALTTYLASLSPAYNDYTQDTAIVSATFNSKFQDAYTARQTLLNKLDGTNFTIATNANTTATNGLNPDGTVKTDKVATAALVDNSVSATFGATMAGSLTGSAGYAFQTAISHTVVMADAGDLIIWADIQQAYSSGTLPQAWQIQITVDGTGVNIKGGAGWGTDSGSIQAIKTALAAGSHTIELQWRGDNSNLSLSSASMEGMYRYK